MARRDVEGQGGAAGHGKGSARVVLAPVDVRQTKLSYTVEAQVGGKIAQVGSRLVDMAAQKLANDFFAAFAARLAAAGDSSGSAEEMPESAATGGWWQRLAARLARLFGR